MSRRRSREAVAPSLFPFLAVLLCTMGSLVLILMLIVSGAQASARKIADQVSMRQEEAEATLELAASSYSRQLEDGQFELEKKRLMLQHFEEHIRELLDELSALEKKVALLDSESEADASEIEQQREAITELEKQLAEAEEELKQKLDKPDGDKPIFAVIPYQGSNGTLRRPIYVECVNDGILIQPEGIFLSEQDLQPPHGPGNPLDAALRTIRSEYRPQSGAINESAYPLLIVRPSGIRAYTYARSAMNGWDDQFGYELISEDLELVYPESKPGLKEKVAQTVALARSRQSALVSAMPRKYKGFSSLRGGRGGSGSGGELGTAGHASGNAGLRSQGNTSGSSALGSSTLGTGLGGNSFGGAGEIGGVGEIGRGNSTSGNFGSPLTDPSGFATGGSQPSLESGDGLQFFGDGGSASGSTNSLLSQNQTGGGDAATNGDGTLGGGADSFEGQEFGSGPNASNSAAGSGSTEGNSNNLVSSSGNQSANSGMSGNGGTGNEGSAGGSAGADSGRAGATSGGAQASNSNMAGNPGPADQNQSGGGAPSLAAQFGQAGRGERTSAVAHTRGRNWAWSRGPTTQTAVVRSIHLHCFSDRWVLLPDDGNPSRGTTITFEKSPEERAVALAQAIQKRVSGWGLALTGGYWRPVLVVDVSPAAKWRFEQLRQLMDGSGIEIKLRERNP